MENKKNKTQLTQIIALCIMLSSIAGLLALAIYFSFFFEGDVMPNEYISFLIALVVIYFVFRYLHYTLAQKNKPKLINTHAQSDEAIAYNLNRKQKDAENLAMSLKDAIEPFGLKRVRVSYLGYDLIYYIKPSWWFGFTYHDDYRDDYVEVSLGQLHNYNDIMKRVVIKGSYNDVLVQLRIAIGYQSELIEVYKGCKNINKNLEIIQKSLVIVLQNIDIIVKQQINDSHYLEEIKTIDDLLALDKHAIIEEV